MLKKIATTFAFMKAPKTTYLFRNPKKGPKNLLALRGAKSLLKSNGAKVAAGLAAAVPVALAAKKRLTS